VKRERRDESPPNAVLRQVRQLVLVLLKFENNLHSLEVSALSAVVPPLTLTGLRSTTPLSSSTSPVNVALIKKLWYTLGRFHGPERIERMSSDE
jgi:hypothetical protein